MVMLIFNSICHRYALRILNHYLGTTIFIGKLHSYIIVLSILNGKGCLRGSWYQSWRCIQCCLYSLRGRWCGVWIEANLASIWRCQDLLVAPGYYLGLRLCHKSHLVSCLSIQGDHAHWDIKLVNWLILL